MTSARRTSWEGDSFSHEKLQARKQYEQAVSYLLRYATRGTCRRKLLLATSANRTSEITVVL